MAVQFIPAAIAAAAKIGGAILGKKKAPEAIPLEEVDLREVSGEALGVNLENLEDIETLIGESSRITDEQTLATLDRLIPGYRNLQTQLVDFATERATNPYDLPSEIVDQLARVSAERGFRSGVDIRSGVGSFDFLRNLGMTSLEFGRQNISDATNIFGQVRSATPIYSPINPSSFYFTPGGVASMRGRENEINQTILQGEENERVSVGNQNRQGVVSAVQSGVGGIVGALADAGYFTPSKSGPPPGSSPVI